MADSDAYNEWKRVDSYFPISETIVRKFKFRIKEPTFLIFLVNFDKDLSGGALSVVISHVPNGRELEKLSNKKKKEKMIPMFYSTDTYDSTTFVHERLDPYLSGDMKVSAPGDYIVTVKSRSNLSLDKKIQQNKYVPKCSKVSMYYQLVRISDIESTYDEEFASETGSIDDSGNNCKNVEIDSIQAVQSAVERQRIQNYMDINAKVLIPDPSARKGINFVMRSGNKAVLSVIKITAALPEEIRKITNMKIQLKATAIKGKTEEDLITNNSRGQHEKEVSFVIDDTESKGYLVTVEFEDVDFELLQTHCSFIELRIAREPAFNMLATLGAFEKSKGYMDIASLSNSPKTITIDKEKTVKLSFYQKKDAVLTQKNQVLGRITVDVKLDQAQIDIIAEYNYISTNIHLEMIGDDKFADHSVFEVGDEHFNSNKIYTARNAIRVIGTGDVFTKGTYTLLIKSDLYQKEILKSLQENDIDIPEDILIPFTIKIESTPVKENLKPVDDKIRVIDIEYNDDPDDNAKAVNYLQDLTIVLQFNDNLDNIKLDFNNLQSSFAVLKLDEKFHKGVKKGDRTIKPTDIDDSKGSSELFEIEKTDGMASFVQLTFPAKSLIPGATYHLELDSRIELNPDIKEEDLLTIKVLNTKCNPNGVINSGTKEDGSCKCKYPYTGPTCHK